ncbi:hemolysin family protein [Candidatus Igneacidithiobacillus taiwanensis]|uniref:hemolysin family protein n=1 Tax=Candidatus Igneacidithiobacillus taiwanensis TaxID=1945924 RepID=UPI00289A5A79|nr:hemolysin family protein [Candidatus Igneacidithiobacillus taiwanensis]
MPESLPLFAAVVLILINGFFVAAEFSLVRLRSTQLRSLVQAHAWRGRILRRVHRHLDIYLSATQLGITLASLALGWIGEPAVAQLLRPLFRLWGLQPEVQESTSFAVAFVLVAFATIIFGELAPKSLAIRKTEQISLWTALPLYVFYWLLYPAIVLLNGVTQLVLRIVGLSAGGKPSESPPSRDELEMILALSQSHGTLGSRTGDILERALDFHELSAGDLARPAADMVCLMEGDDRAKIRRTLLRYRYTRYPLCAGDRQHVRGLVHVKDLLPVLLDSQGALDLLRLARPLPAVAKDLPAMELLAHFRSGQPHFALVVDALGTITGFVTLDHVLEALLGRIPDEFRHWQRDWQEQADGSWIGSGSLSIYSLEQVLDRDIDEAGEADSIGGLLMQRLDRLPEEGERVEFRDFDVLVLRREGPRIASLQVFPHPAADPEEWFA